MKTGLKVLACALYAAALVALFMDSEVLAEPLARIGAFLVLCAAGVALWERAGL
jgi:hypothetical protein